MGRTLKELAKDLEHQLWIIEKSDANIKVDLIYRYFKKIRYMPTRNLRKMFK